MELNTALGILGGLLILYFAGGFMFDRIAENARHFWGELSRPEMDLHLVSRRSVEMGLGLLLILAPLLAGVFLLGVLVNVMQIGFLFAPEVMSLKLENLDPVRGFSRLFSRRVLIEFCKAFWSEIGALSALLMFRTGLTLLFLALFDYWYQKWEYEQSLKMSKQEIKDEYKQLEGDPLIKARIRRLQQESARRRMLAELPTADVVITNPTHLAVAVKYDETAMDAPRVVAKGARLVAQRIKQLAREHRIPVLENKPLARALYETTPVGAQVPSALFDAVAQLLAFVYQMQGRLQEKALRNRERLVKKGALVLSPFRGENGIS
jgi:flagellar biosynthetic protein FlhB